MSLRSKMSTAAAALLFAAGAAFTAQPSQSATPAADKAPESPRFLPVPEDIVKPQEAAVLSRLLKRLVEADTHASSLRAADEALRNLPEPTPARGLVQFWRASQLLYQDMNVEAVDAIEESIRLLPNYSGPLLTAASIYGYANQPAKGVDYFLRASRIDPDTVRTIDDYEINMLIGRLKTARDEQRANALSDRLLEIGWIGRRLDSRSSLAQGAIERRLEAGDVRGAQALVSKLLSPSHSYRLLASSDFRAVWPDVEMWAGPKLRNQWEIYLREARERWAASKDTNAVRDYSSALLAAGHDQTVIREILPLFYGKLDKERDQDLLFVVTGVADALAREGRWAEVDRLFEQAQKVWPLSQDNQNSLNVAANWARFLLYAGKAEQALKKMDAALDLARKWQVNPDAVTQMYHYRACILHKLGRGEEAGVAMAIAGHAAFPDEIARLHACMGNDAAARRALLDGLKSESDQYRVLLFVQPNSTRPYASKYGQEIRAALERLRADPELQASAQKYGRILPYSVAEGAPAEARPVR
jgi:tetratricopeptide (TPR) repeat protein